MRAVNLKLNHVLKPCDAKGKIRGLKPKCNIVIGLSVGLKLKLLFQCVRTARKLRYLDIIVNAYTFLLLLYFYTFAYANGIF